MYTVKNNCKSNKNITTIPLTAKISQLVQITTLIYSSLTGQKTHAPTETLTEVK